MHLHRCVSKLCTVAYTSKKYELKLYKLIVILVANMIINNVIVRYNNTLK